MKKFLMNVNVRLFVIVLLGMGLVAIPYDISVSRFCFSIVWLWWFLMLHLSLKADMELEMQIDEKNSTNFDIPFVKVEEPKQEEPKNLNTDEELKDLFDGVEDSPLNDIEDIGRDW